MDGFLLLICSLQPLLSNNVYFNFSFVLLISVILTVETHFWLPMRVFKFGGASVNSANAVKNVASILQCFTNEQVITIISAMGKTTNAMEELTQSYFTNTDFTPVLERIKQYHLDIIQNLYPESDIRNAINSFSEITDELLLVLNSNHGNNYDFEYDRIVSYGELISTRIVSDYLNYLGFQNQWLDVRKVVKTNSNWREGKVDWMETQQNMNAFVSPYFADKSSGLIITQGFIASDKSNNTLTLGREGSDYSAAIFAYCMNASDMTIWKDVPGLLNADPKFFPEAKKIDSISYNEAIELAYYGATIIHPKTIKPLQNKGISLFVKSFINPDTEGTLICNNPQSEIKLPCYIFKQKQILLSIYPKDFSFIAEENLSHIFALFASNNIKINLMQNSAISFSVCMDENKERFEGLLQALNENYKIRFNENLTLITIRHYDQQTIDQVIGQRKIILEQYSRLTAQIIVSD
jgi:aspartate kinase